MKKNNEIITEKRCSTTTTVVEVKRRDTTDPLKSKIQEILKQKQTEKPSQIGIPIRGDRLKEIKKRLETRNKASTVSTVNDPFKKFCIDYSRSK